MKQVKVNDLVVLTAPDRDAYLAAATIARQVILHSDRPTRRMVMERAAERIARGHAARFQADGVDIRVVDADITHHVPDCEHELYAAGRCRTPACVNYYLRPERSEMRKDVAA